MIRVLQPAGFACMFQFEVVDGPKGPAAANVNKI